jgi:hypothetical protein
MLDEIHFFGSIFSNVSMLKDWSRTAVPNLRYVRNLKEYSRYFPLIELSLH